ncbi:MAG: pyridoxamine 5-phosphate oxidase [Candidatus Dadabacteria bacterium]
MKSKFYSGEIAIQMRAGVRNTADRVAGIIHPTIPLVAQDFLGSQRMVVLATLDKYSCVWASILTGKPGFIQALDEHVVKISAEPIPGDPLRGNLEMRDEIGILAIEFASRRRMKVKGKSQMKGDGIYIYAERVYALCPKYIQAREVVASVDEPKVSYDVRCNNSLTQAQQNWIARADTFFIASFHPETRADASHRGGFPGFVRVLSENRLVFPDYSGNKMFNTLGNIFANPNAGLIFIDFDGGNTLQITGQAQVIWNEDCVSEFAGAERIVEFQIEQLIEIPGAIPLGWRFIEYSPFNPG